MISQLEELITNKTILILGFGREGKSTYQFLRKYFPNLPLAIADKNSIDGTSLTDVQVFSGERYLDALDKFDLIIKSPGIPLSQTLIQKYQKQLTSQTDIFLKLCPAKIVGITGSKGKSTTSSLLHHVLQSSGYQSVLVGNIGIPPLDLLDQLSGEEIVVFEMSSHQTQVLTTSPAIAVVLNIFRDHLDYYSSFDEYVQAKLNIGKHQEEGDLLIINSNDPVLNSWVKEASTKATVKPILNSFAYDNKNLIPANVLAVVTITKELGLENQQIQSAIKSFSNLPLRREYEGEFRGIKIYNDSAASIPEATIAGIDILTPDVLIVGGYDKGLDYSALVEKINSSQIKNVILIPDTGNLISPLLEGRKAQLVSTLEEAVEILFDLSPAPKTCLFSPAAASFNMFKSFVDRGERFRALIRARASYNIPKQQ
jgi:UDP-N-acetylmuramoyl-L-alanine---L-glutamate ligase